MIYAGLNNLNGQSIFDMEHIRQSVRDVLLTPLGTRIQRRDYGSFIPQLIDAPLNDASRQRVMAATVMALVKWEPRIRVSKVLINQNGASLTIDLSAIHKATSKDVALSIPLLGAGA